MNEGDNKSKPLGMDGASADPCVSPVAERETPTAALICFAIGGFLLLCALALAGFNFHQDWAAQRSAAAATQAIESQMDKSQLGDSDEASKRICRKIKPDMPTIDVDGVSYVGRIEIDALGLELPVVSSYSLSVLNTAPARYAGSIYAGNMVVCGHNFASHFGTLYQLAAGDAVTFKDNYGLNWTYSVSSVENVDGKDVEGMLAGSSAEVSGGWDLTLFTCDFSGNVRVTIRCVSTDE